jgi:hypothetical protein
LVGAGGTANTHANPKCRLLQSCTFLWKNFYHCSAICANKEPATFSEAAWDPTCMKNLSVWIATFCSGIIHWTPKTETYWSPTSKTKLMGCHGGESVFKRLSMLSSIYGTAGRNLRNLMESPHLSTFARISEIFIEWIFSLLFISTVNWSCIQFMASYCAPWRITGPIHNLFHMASPLCGSINKFQVALSDQYYCMWQASATTLILECKKIKKWMKKK